MMWEWAVCEALVLGLLVREWFSIRGELRRDAERRAAEQASSTAPGHTEGQHALHEGVTEARE